MRTPGEKSRKLVEVLGPWVLNKGDDMMLRAIVDRLSSRCQVAMSSMLHVDRIPEGLRIPKVKWPPDRREIVAALRSRSASESYAVLRKYLALSLVPRSLLRSLGFVRGDGVSWLFDCSGFGYSDQFPGASALHRRKLRASYYAKLRKRGARLIMLPQALGPFQNSAVAAVAREVFEQFELIYARDELSYRYVRDLGYGDSVVRMAPDFTNLLEGRPPANPEAWSSRVCIVPNARMLQKTDAETGDWYLDFLTHAIHRVRDGGLEPCLLLHEANDLPLARQAARSAGFSVPVIDEDALVSKGILGACHAVISSRYHALISALSQATPALGTAWAHKYKTLFDDYDCRECLLESINDSADIDAKLSRLLEPRSRQELAHKLLPAAETQKRRSREMWREIERRLAGGVEAGSSG